MAKYHGFIGFAENREKTPGVWEDHITEVEYFGDVLSNSFGTTQNEVNNGIRLNNRISIISDTFAIENIHLMRYVTYMGKKWTITNIDPQYPRLILSIGGLYNAPN